jgi:hypothetical protein
MTAFIRKIAALFRREPNEQPITELRLKFPDGHEVVKSPEELADE